MEKLKGRDTLLVLSAKEVIPNVIVTTYLTKELKQLKKVLILTTEWNVSQQMAKNQAFLFNRQGLETQIVQIPTYAFKEIEEKLSEAITEGILKPDKTVYLTNAGTKYTTEVVHHFLTGRGGLSIYYLPTGEVKIFGGDYLFKIQKPVLKVEDFLNLMGFEVKLKNKIVYKPLNHLEPLFNFYKTLIEKGEFCTPPKSNNKRRQIVQKEKELWNISLPGSYGYNFFKDLYTAGDALELFTYYVLKNSGIFDDVLPNVEILKIQNKKRIENEIDVLAVKNNVLFYFSCKRGTRVNWSEHIHRVANLARQLGGRYTVPILVACEKKETIAEKGKLLGINWITPKTLLKFLENPREYLNKWQINSIGFILA